MALYPAAQQRIWKPYDPERYITPTTIILHTNAVNSEDPGSTGGLSWHFQCGEHGDIYQHRDTETRAAANVQANAFAISIETWDGGDPEGNPWSDAQLDALVKLIDWCCTTHNIPRVQPGTWDSAGIGYHRMFSEWNKPVHSCPGDTRAAQFHDVLLPRLQQPSEDDLNDDQNKWLQETDLRVAEIDDKVKHIEQMLGSAITVINEIKAKLGA